MAKTKSEIESRMKRISKNHKLHLIEYANVKNKGSKVNKERDRVESELKNDYARLRELSWVCNIKFDKFVR